MPNWISPMVHLVQHPDVPEESVRNLAAEAQSFHNLVL